MDWTVIQHVLDSSHAPLFTGHAHVKSPLNGAGGMERKILSPSPGHIGHIRFNKWSGIKGFCGTS
jgi:hypothetical protein